MPQHRRTVRPGLTEFFLSAVRAGAVQLEIQGAVVARAQVRAEQAMAAWLAAAQEAVAQAPAAQAEVARAEVAQAAAVLVAAARVARAVARAVAVPAALAANPVVESQPQGEGGWTAALELAEQVALSARASLRGQQSPPCAESKVTANPATIAGPTIRHPSTRPVVQPTV